MKALAVVSKKKGCQEIVNGKKALTEECNKVGRSDLHKENSLNLATRSWSSDSGSGVQLFSGELKSDGTKSTDFSSLVQEKMWWAH